MFCTNCGKKLRIEDLFCANCGTKVVPIEDNTLVEKDTTINSDSTSIEDVVTKDDPVDQESDPTKKDSTHKEKSAGKEDLTDKKESVGKEDLTDKKESVGKEDSTHKEKSAGKEDLTSLPVSDKKDLSPSADNTLLATKKKIIILLSTAVAISLLFLLSTFIISITYLRTSSAELSATIQEPITAPISSSPVSVETLHAIETSEEDNMLAEFETLDEETILEMIDKAYIRQANILTGYLYNMQPTSDNFYPMNAKFNSYEKIDRYLTGSWAKGYALVFLDEFSYALRRSSHGYYILGSDMACTPNIESGKVEDISLMDDLIKVNYSYLNSNNTHSTDAAWFTKEDGKWKMTTLDVGKIERSDIKIEYI